MIMKYCCNLQGLWELALEFEIRSRNGRTFVGSYINENYYYACNFRSIN